MFEVFEFNEKIPYFIFQCHPLVCLMTSYNLMVPLMFTSPNVRVSLETFTNSVRRDFHRIEGKNYTEIT